MPRFEEPRFSVRVTAEGDDVTVRVQGPLDAHTVDEVAADLLAIPPGSEAVLDLTGVSFLDSHALRALRATVERLDSRGVPVRYRTSESVDRTMDAEAGGGQRLPPRGPTCPDS